MAAASPLCKQEVMGSDPIGAFEMSHFLIPHNRLLIEVRDIL